MYEVANCLVVCGAYSLREGIKNDNNNNDNNNDNNNVNNSNTNNNNLDVI